MNRISIAIDGPAGAGKSTIAKGIARKLGIFYLDTGAMYRTVALKAVRERVPTKDRERIKALIEDIKIDIVFKNNEQHMILDNEDVSQFIRSSEISVAASDVSAVPEVRIKMVELQREFASKHDVVMEGRDIGTYVLPNALIKIFLTASVEERARRRYKQLLERGTSGISLEEIIKEIEYRDKNDSNRDFAPLMKAKDAVEIDTTHLTVEQVMDKILNHIKSITEINNKNN